jgi:hypothetical protein
VHRQSCGLLYHETKQPSRELLDDRGAKSGPAASSHNSRFLCLAERMKASFDLCRGRQGLIRAPYWTVNGLLKQRAVAQEDMMYSLMSVDRWKAARSYLTVTNHNAPSAPCPVQHHLPGHGRDSSPSPTTTRYRVGLRRRGKGQPAAVLYRLLYGARWALGSQLAARSGRMTRGRTRSWVR